MIFELAREPLFRAPNSGVAGAPSPVKFPGAGSLGALPPSRDLELAIQIQRELEIVSTHGWFWFSDDLVRFERFHPSGSGFFTPPPNRIYIHDLELNLPREEIISIIRSRIAYQWRKSRNEFSDQPITLEEIYACSTWTIPARNPSGKFNLKTNPPQNTAISSNQYAPDFVHANNHTSENHPLLPLLNSLLDLIILSEIPIPQNPKPADQYRSQLSNLISKINPISANRYENCGRIWIALGDKHHLCLDQSPALCELPICHNPYCISHRFRRKWDDYLPRLIRALRSRSLWYVHFNSPLGPSLDPSEIESRFENAVKALRKSCLDLRSYIFSIHPHWNGSQWILDFHGLVIAKFICFSSEKKSRKLENIHSLWPYRIWINPPGKFDPKRALEYILRRAVDPFDLISGNLPHPKILVEYFSWSYRHHRIRSSGIFRQRIQKEKYRAFCPRCYSPLKYLGHSPDLIYLRLISGFRTYVGSPLYLPCNLGLLLFLLKSLDSMIDRG